MVGLSSPTQRTDATNKLEQMSTIATAVPLARKGRPGLAERAGLCQQGLRLCPLASYVSLQVGQRAMQTISQFV